MIKSGKNIDNSGFPAFTFITFKNNFLQTLSLVISGFQLLFDLADFQLPSFSLHSLPSGWAPVHKRREWALQNSRGNKAPTQAKPFSKERFIIHVSQYFAFNTNPTFILFSLQCCLFNISTFIRLIGITRSTVTHIKKPSLAVTQRGLIFLYLAHHHISKFTVSYTKNTVFISNY